MSTFKQKLRTKCILFWRLTFKWVFMPVQFTDKTKFHLLVYIKVGLNIRFMTSITKMNFIQNFNYLVL